MSKLTREQIETMRQSMKQVNAPWEIKGWSEIIDPLCDLALQSLSLESVRSEALANEVQEIFSRIANYQAVSGNIGLVTLTIREFAMLRRALQSPARVAEAYEPTPDEVMAASHTADASPESPAKEEP